MTIRENIAFPLRIRKRPQAEIDDAVARAARTLELEPLLDRTPGQLSGGQRQRVAMGRAIVRTPSVFLFDEPLSNLDASLRAHMRVELKRLHRQLETTTVHVTHDQVEALTLADRIVVLNGGVVQQVGTPRELFDTPANTFVAQFIGSPSMNLLARDGHTLGVRPTDIRVDSGSPQRARVDVVASMGAEAMLHLVMGEESLVAQVPEPCGVAAGDEIGVRFEVEHRFDPDTGARIS